MAIDAAALAAMRNEPLDWRFKAAPLTATPHAATPTAVDLSRSPQPMSAFGTPLLTLNAGALAHNIAVMADWAQGAGVLLAPHGKTTMAPALWQRQLDAGAWGITLANVPQLRVARAFGVRRVMLAAPLLDPAALAWARAQPDFEVVCWADSVRAVELMSAPGTRPIDVCVELGAPGGRTGARTSTEARAVAEAVRRAPGLRLVGVAGYEGALAHDATPGSIAVVDAYLQRLGVLASSLEFETGEPFVTAGGSAYFDRVAAVLGGDGMTVVVRAGAYVISDDGFYRGISPLRHTFRSAMHGWARVISRPEPELALLDAGKRDLPFDEGLPEPHGIPGAVVMALKDQHAFLQLPPDAPVRVGDVIRLGLSHPCTALDKWQLIPVIDDADAAEPVVVDAIRTFF